MEAGEARQSQLSVSGLVQQKAAKIPQMMSANVFNSRSAVYA